MPRFRRLVALTAVALGLSFPAAAQPPSTDSILDRVAVYLRDYVPRLARVVASEDYEQRITFQSGNGISTMVNDNFISGSPVTATDLWRPKSEVLLVRYPLGDVDWMWFRDVGEANGKKLPHDADRLMQLFVTPTVDAAEQAAPISYEASGTTSEARPYRRPTRYS